MRRIPCLTSSVQIYNSHPLNTVIMSSSCSRVMKCSLIKYLSSRVGLLIIVTSQFAPDAAVGFQTRYCCDALHFR